VEKQNPPGIASSVNATATADLYVCTVTEG